MGFCLGIKNNFIRQGLILFPRLTWNLTTCPMLALNLQWASGLSLKNAGVSHHTQCDFVGVRQVGTDKRWGEPANFNTFVCTFSMKITKKEER